MNKKLLNTIKLIAFIGIGVLLFWLAIRKQDINKILDDLTHANYWWAILSLVFALLSNLSRALRWNMLIEPLGYKPKVFNTFTAVMMAYLVNLAIPRAGEISRCVVVNKYEKVPINSLLGTVVVERVFDVIALVILLLFVIFSQFNLMSGFVSDTVLNPLGDRLSGLLQIGAGFYLVMVLIIVFLIMMTVLVVRKFRKSKYYLKFIDILKGFVDGIRSVGKMKNRNLFILHTIFIWSAYVIMTYTVFFCLPATSHLNLLVGVSIMVFGGIGFVIPSPGGTGSYHIIVTSALMLYGLSGENAFSFAAISHATQTIAVIVFGTLFFALLPLYNRNRMLKEENPVS